MPREEGRGSQAVTFPFTPHLRRIAAVLAGLAAMSYALGYVVVNRHLAQFGYSSFALLRSSYIGAGLWATLPFMFAGLVLLAGSRLIPETSEGADGRSARRRALRWTGRPMLYALGAVTAAFALISVQIVCGVSTDNMICGLLATIAVMLAATECRRSLRTPASSAYRLLDRIRLVAAVSLLPVAMWAFLNYASATYSQVPFGLGGGRPRPIKLIVDSTHVSRRQLEFASLAPDSLWSVRAALLMRTDVAWVVAAPGFRRAAIEIPAEAIRLAVFSRPPRSKDRAGAVAEWIETFGADFSNTDSILTRRSVGDRQETPPHP
jgi:hypothetical protein